MKCIHVAIVVLLSIMGLANVAVLAADEPIEISIWIQSRPEAEYTAEHPIIQEITKRTGVSIKFELAPYEYDAALEKFNLMLASGDLPDVIIFRKAEIDRAAQQGILTPLSDPVDEYAPNFKKIIEEDPAILKDLKIGDGEFYHFPLLSAVRTAQIFIIRQDWLGKLGLDAPETLDDWYNVLKAFKEQNPNGNGEADEVPFTTRGKAAGILPFMEAWGISGYEPSQQFFIEEGQVKFAYIDPRFKEALAFLNKLYSEGLIDPEYVTGDKNLWTARLSGEVSGVTFDWFPRIDYFNRAVQGVNPNAVFAGVLPPIGPTGIRMTTNQQKRVREEGATAISITSKHKERIVQFLDYFFGEGAMFMNFGIEGVYYDMVDGYPTFKPELLNNPDKSILYYLFESGRFELSHKQDIRYENQLAPADVLAARDMYEPILIEAFPPLALTEDERDIMLEKYSEIQTYKDEMVDKFIMGAESLDKFEEFVAQIKKMGIDDVLAVQQAAFDRYNSK